MKMKKKKKCNCIKHGRPQFQRGRIGAIKSKTCSIFNLRFWKSISPPLYVWITLQTVSFSLSFFLSRCSLLISYSSIIFAVHLQISILNFFPYLCLDLQMPAVSNYSSLRFSVSRFSKLSSVSASFSFSF